MNISGGGKARPDRRTTTIEPSAQKRLGLGTSPGQIKTSGHGSRVLNSPKGQQCQ